MALDGTEFSSPKSKVSTFPIKLSFLSRISCRGTLNPLQVLAQPHDWRKPWRNGNCAALPASLTSVLLQASSSASAGAASWRALGSLTRAGTTQGVNQPAEELTARINSSGAGENEIVGN